MIDHAVRERVQKLLAEGLFSHRQIAIVTGVARATVGQIGRHGLGVARPKATSVLNVAFTGPLQRCPTCGGMCHMPCRLCAVRKLKYGTDER